MDIKTKYNIGDKVWYMTDNQTKESEITYVYSTNHNTSDIGQITSIDYGLSDRTSSIKESYLFRTKQDLLNSL